MKTNIKMKTAVQDISKVIKDADLLFGLEIGYMGSLVVLDVITDKADVQFSASPKFMASLLEGLKSSVPENAEDFETLLNVMTELVK